MSCFPGMPCWQNTSNENGCNPPVFTWFPCGCAPFTINSTNVIYTGDNLPNSLINTNDNLTLSLSKIDDALSAIIGNAVPETRTITINGVTQDLSADRTWNTITLNSFSGGTGISYNNLTGVITNSAPDQTVVLTQGSNITITGTYPNFTISATGGGGGITNSAPNGFLMLSDGTNAIDSGLSVPTKGRLAAGGSAGMTSQGFSAVIGEFQLSNNSTSLDVPLRVSHYSTVPNTGIGVGIEFGSSTSSTGPTSKIGAVIGTLATNVGIGTESFDFVTNLMAGGATAAEAFRVLSTGSVTFGGGLSGASRTLLAGGTASDIGINVIGKGLGTIGFSSNGVTYNFNGNTFNLANSTGSISNSSGTLIISSASANPGKPIKLLSGDGASSGQPSGDTTISSGNGVTTGNSGNLLLGTGTGGNATGNITISTGNATTASGNIFLQTGTGGTSRGNIALFSSTGSFGSGQQVVFINNALTLPSGNPVGGGILYTTSGTLAFKGTSGEIISTTSSGGMSFTGSDPTLTYANAGNTITYYSETNLVTGASAGGFTQAINFPANIPNKSTIYVEAVVLGIQTTATAGAKGYCIRMTAGYRKDNGGTINLIGASTTQLSVIDSPDSIGAATLTTNGSQVLVNTTISTSVNYNYTVNCKFSTGQ